MAERYYSSVAVQTNLSSGIGTSDTTIQVDSTAGFPAQTPYTLIIDIDTDAEEIVEVTSVAGNVLTVTREIDGSVAQEHELDATVTHGATARDWQDSRDHEEASSQVHGLGAGDGTLVGTTSTNTLENKTIDGGDNTLQNVPQSAITNLVSDQSTQDTAIAANAAAIGVNADAISDNADDIEALDTRLTAAEDALEAGPERPACKLMNTVAQTGIQTGTVTVLNMNNVLWDTDDMANLGGNRIVCKRKGVYAISAGWRANVGSGNRVGTYILVNGEFVDALNLTAPSGTNTYQAHTQLALDVDDYVQAGAFQVTGDDQDTVAPDSQWESPHIAVGWIGA